MTSFFDQSAQTALLNLPSAGPGTAKQSITCLFAGLKGKRLFIECQEKPPLSAPLSIEYGDSLFLGEVVNLINRGNGSWQAEIKVEQILSGLQSLIALRSRLLGENARAGRSSANSVFCRWLTVPWINPICCKLDAAESLGFWRRRPARS